MPEYGDRQRIRPTLAGRAPFAGDGGAARDAVFAQAGHAISDGTGGLLIADTNNCSIRRVNAQGDISTFAGQPGICRTLIHPFWAGTSAAQVRFNRPVALARDRRGNVFVSEGSAVHRISPDLRVTTLEILNGPAGLALDSSEANLYVVERTGNRISRIHLATGITTVFAGAPDETGGFAGDGRPATQARFSLPSDIAVDRNNNIFVADTMNHRIRRIDGLTNVVSTVAELPLPGSVAVDAEGVIHATSGHSVVRILNGQFEVIAGSTEGGYAGDGSYGPSARFNGLASLRLDGPSLLLADSGNNRIRSLTPMRSAAFQLVSGNNQSAAVRTTAANPLIVAARLSDGTPAPGITVSFSASAGTFDPPGGVVVTGNDGNATVRFVMPAAAGPVTVTAAVPGLPPVTFALTALPTATVARPRIGSVITASTFGAATRIAPGGWIELYGTGFTNETQEWSSADFTGPIAPTALGGVRVLINDRPAFLQFVSPGQINAVVPDGIGAGRVPVQVINAAGNSETFLTEAVPRAPALLAPASFTSDGRQYVAALLPDGAFAGPEKLGAAFRPARSGDRLVLYGVGFGLTAPALPAGQIAAQLTTLPNLRVTVGGVAARVDYGGLAAGLVGLYQFNIVVPEVPAGPAPLAVTVDGTALAQALFLAVGQ